MNLLLKCAPCAVSRMANSQGIRELLPALAGFAGLDPLRVAYNDIGTLNYENEVVSGENFLTGTILTKNLCDCVRPLWTGFASGKG